MLVRNALKKFPQNTYKCRRLLWSGGERSGQEFESLKDSLFGGYCSIALRRNAIFWETKERRLDHSPVLWIYLVVCDPTVLCSRRLFIKGLTNYFMFYNGVCFRCFFILAFGAMHIGVMSSCCCARREGSGETACINSFLTMPHGRMESIMLCSTVSSYTERPVRIMSLDSLARCTRRICLRPTTWLRNHAQYLPFVCSQSAVFLEARIFTLLTRHTVVDQGSPKEINPHPIMLHSYWLLSN